jgi:hypothetical protein
MPWSKKLANLKQLRPRIESHAAMGGGERRTTVLKGWSELQDYLKSCRGQAVTITLIADEPEMTFRVSPSHE